MLFSFSCIAGHSKTLLSLAFLLGQKRNKHFCGATRLDAPPWRSIHSMRTNMRWLW